MSQSDSLTIRGYLPDDKEAVWRVHIAAIEVLGPRPKGAIIDELDADFHDIESAFLRTGGEFLVGTVGRRIVALGGLKRLSNAAAEITKMRVDPEHWRRGYGQAILDALQARATELGFRELWLDTTPKQFAAWQLYLKNGFQEIRTTKLWNFDVIILKKDLPVP